MAAAAASTSAGWTPLDGRTRGAPAAPVGVPARLPLAERRWLNAAGWACPRDLARRLHDVPRPDAHPLQLESFPDAEGGGQVERGVPLSVGRVQVGLGIRERLHRGNETAGRREEQRRGLVQVARLQRRPRGDEPRDEALALSEGVMALAEQVQRCDPDGRAPWWSRPG